MKKIITRYFFVWLAVFQLFFLHALDAQAMFRLVFEELIEVSHAVKSLSQRRLSTAPKTRAPVDTHLNSTVEERIKKEIEALSRSHNPTGTKYRKPESNDVVLYPEWDLASVARPVSRAFNVVTGVQNVSDVGFVGTLKKK